MSSSSLALIVNLTALAVFGYSVYYMNFNTKSLKLHDIIPSPLRPYGNLKFLTYQCLLIQLVSAFLHVGAHFWRSLEKLRDIVFTVLAYPVGNVVVYSFWTVWHLMGRELIFPTVVSQFYPDWLNHSTHTIIVPINILTAILVNHKYSQRGAVLTVVYFAFYTVYLHIIKMQSGMFVYQYLSVMNDLQRAIYFAGTGIFSYLMYKSGEYLSNLVHQKASQRPAIKKSKQK